MTSCTQPSCTGTILDDYCAVCGSPASAALFVPAEAVALETSTAPAEEAGLSTVRPGSASLPEPKNAGLNTACTQPGCTGTIVDGYCDLCGSPAGAVPFVPAAASAVGPTPADQPGVTAIPAPTRVPATVEEEIPTQGITRVKMPRPQLSTQEIADSGAAATGEKELAEDEPNKDYRTRVEEAQLPNDVRETALREVGKLERTSDEGPESGDIRAWLDTILYLPWSTKTTDWIDIEGSREVEATLRRLIEPAVADTEEADAEEGELAVADAEEADAGEGESAVADTEEADAGEGEPAAAAIENAGRAAADRHNDDTVETPAVLAVPSGGRHPHSQLPEQQVVGPVVVQTPAEKRRFGSLALIVTALAALLFGALFFAGSRDGSVTAQSAPTVTATVSKPTSEPSNEPTNTGGEESPIQLADLTDSARPFETVRIQGTYRGGEDTFLRVQRKEGGKWVDFPLPTKTNRSGQFTAYVEFGQPGRYRLRVLDPDSGVTSKAFVLLITG
jgi:hypothetical protein